MRYSIEGVVEEVGIDKISQMTSLSKEKASQMIHLKEA